jgi:parvulin-like peptidyl-prolyl isomerase
MAFPDGSKLARYRLLRPYLRQEVLEEVLQPVALDDEEKVAARRQFLVDQRLKGEEALAAYAARHQLSEEDLQYLITYPVKIWKICQEHFAPRAESRFLARKSHLDQVVYSLLRTQDAGLARELFLQVREGEQSFAELAAAYAEGPERATRGIIGPVPLSQGHPLLVDRLSSAEPGTLLEPFQIESWWVLVRLENTVPASFGPDVADAMTQELLDEWLEEQVDRRLNNLPQLPLAASA